MLLTRRGFVGRTAGVLAGTILGSRTISNGLEGKAPHVRFAAMLPKRPIRERARLAERLGYQGIELSMGCRSWELSPEFVLAELKGTAIEVSAIGGACQFQNQDAKVRAQGIEQDRKCLELAKAVGATQVGEHYLPAGDTLQKEDWLVIDGLRQLATDVKRTGVEIVLEPLSNSKDKRSINLQSHGVRVLKAIGAPGIKLVSDFNHMQLENNDIGQSLTRWGVHTGAVHLPGEKRFVPGGELFDYRPGFRALKGHGYSGWLTIECYFDENDPEPELARALKYVKQQWSES